MQYHAKKWFNNAYVNAMAAIAIGAMLVFSVAGMKAFADVVLNDVVVDDKTVSITAGEETVVRYKIIVGDNQTPTGDRPGCNVNGANPGTLTVNTPTGVTATPSSLTVTACDTWYSVTFTSETTDTYQITVDVTGGRTESSYDESAAAFTLAVEEDTPTDNTPPELDLPADITQEATGAGGAAVTYTATATDDVDGPVDVTCTPESGSTFALGSTTVNCEAQDEAGNQATGSFSVTIQDKTAPELTLPADITQEATSSSGAAVTYTATATDAVDDSVDVTCTPESGSTFPLGTTPVNCSATDNAGNEATGSFNVIVQDTTKPEFTLPSPITVEATGAGGAAVTYTATATDNIDGPITPECTPESGSTFPLGTTPVNCSATDNAGNEATGSFNVIVQDTIAPVIQVTSTISDGQQFYFGNVPSAPTCTATDSGSGVNSDGCKVTGYATIVGPQTLTFTATDNAGNTATQTIKYTVLPWTLKGFYQPVDMDTSSTIVINTVKGGSVVPLKLEIFQGTTELTSTTFNNNPVGSFAPKKVSCTPGSTEDAIETLATPGSTSFRYDSTSGQFINNWQTPKQPNACYDVIFTSLDGTTLTAHFKLK